MRLGLATYQPSTKDEVLAFFSKAFTELGRDFDLILKERDLADIPAVYQTSGGGFWMLRDGQDGPVIGTVALRRIDGDRAELKRFYLLEAWRGKGLGRKLLETAIRHARERGFARIRLDTTKESKAAIHLFEANGFVPIERYNDDPFAELFYELRLGDRRTSGSHPHDHVRYFVRRLNVGEAELYRAVRLESLRDSPEAFATTYESALQRDHNSWQAQADASASGSDRATFVVVLADRPIGLGAIYRDPDQPQEGELIQVWVSPECRGAEVAADLMNALFEWAAENGFETVRAEVTPDNSRALRFYEKCGFIKTEPSGPSSGRNRLLVRRIDQS